MKRYSFRITKPVKEKEHSFLEKQLKPFSEFLTIPKPIEYVSVDNEQDPKPNLAKALIKGLETNNYNLFGDLLLARKRKDEEKRGSLVCADHTLLTSRLCATPRCGRVLCAG